MALTSQQIERKLNQHGNDIESTYELLTDIQAKQAAHDSLFADIQAKLTTHDSLFADIQAKLTTHDSLFADIQAKLTTHDTRFDTIGSQLGALNDSIADVLRRLPEPPVD